MSGRRRLGFVVALAGAAVAAALTLSVATGAIGDGGTITSCYNNSQNTWRPVENGAACKSNETRLAWSTSGGGSGQQGATGPQGPAGATGPAGADGPPGAVGATGATGPAGVDGQPGGTGATGPAGADGQPGGTGATGPAGADGQPGGTGATGPAGADGQPGGTGATGPAGADGQPGATGATGAAGASGPQGPPGPAGSGGGAPLSPVGPAGVFAFVFTTPGYHDVVSLPLTATGGTWVTFTGWIDIFNGNLAGGVFPAASISCVLVDGSGYTTLYDETRVGTMQSSTTQTTMTVPIALTAWYSGPATARIACQLISSTGTGRISGRLRGLKQ